MLTQPLKYALKLNLLQEKLSKTLIIVCNRKIQKLKSCQEIWSTEEYRKVHSMEQRMSDELPKWKSWLLLVITAMQREYAPRLHAAPNVSSWEPNQIL